MSDFEDTMKENMWQMEQEGITWTQIKELKWQFARSAFWIGKVSEPRRC